MVLDGVDQPPDSDLDLADDGRSHEVRVILGE
jgi:hypothetical protein